MNRIGIHLRFKISSQSTISVIPDDDQENDDIRLIQLPLAKIRNIMKLENNTAIVSLDAAVAVAKATEFFIESLGKLSYAEVSLTKKKTIQKRDVDKVLTSSDALLFLEDSMNVFNTLNK